jgi:hypothetical protein
MLLFALYCLSIFLTRFSPMDYLLGSTDAVRPISWRSRSPADCTQYMRPGHVSSAILCTSTCLGFYLYGTSVALFLEMGPTRYFLTPKCQGNSGRIPEPFHRLCSVRFGPSIVFLGARISLLGALVKMQVTTTFSNRGERQKGDEGSPWVLRAGTLS